MNINADFRMTDELERRLMRQAIEEQFRPHPLMALRNVLASFASAVRATARAMSEARRANSGTQLL